MRGVVASLTWGYYPAATIEGYTVTKKPGGLYTVDATVVWSNAFNLQQTPLAFIAPVRWQDREVEWRWPVLAWELRAGTFGARLGPLEVSDGALSVRPPGAGALVAV